MSETRDNEPELLQLTRDLLDLKLEKKSTNNDFNNRIKELEAQIVECVKE